MIVGSTCWTMQHRTTLGRVPGLDPAEGDAMWTLIAPWNGAAPHCLRWTPLSAAAGDEFWTAVVSSSAPV